MVFRIFTHSLMIWKRGLYEWRCHCILGKTFNPERAGQDELQHFLDGCIYPWEKSWVTGCMFSPAIQYDYWVISLETNPTYIGTRCANEKKASRLNIVWCDHAIDSSLETLPVHFHHRSHRSVCSQRNKIRLIFLLLKMWSLKREITDTGTLRGRTLINETEL